MTKKEAEYLANGKTIIVHRQRRYKSKRKKFIGLSLQMALITLAALATTAYILALASIDTAQALYLSCVIGYLGVIYGVVSKLERWRNGGK